MGSDTPQKNPGRKTLGDHRGKHAIEKKWKLTAPWAGKKNTQLVLSLEACGRKE